jgi:hypothetical protein
MTHALIMQNRMFARSGCDVSRVEEVDVQQRSSRDFRQWGRGPYTKLWGLRVAFSGRMVLCTARRYS